VRVRLLTLVSSSAATVLAGLTIATAVGRSGPFPDLDVYRVSARAIGLGKGVYDVRGANGGPFTYPPFAAFVLWPFTLLPLVATGVVLATASCGAAVTIARLCLRDRPWWLVGVLCACAFETVPFRTTIYFGQIGALLMVAVAVDLLAVRRRWPSGLLIGLAAAVKLTPLMFVPYLFVTGRRREARTAVLTFVGATVAAALALPAASWRYWTSALWESKRVGAIASIHNRSVWGAMSSVGPRSLGALVALIVAVVGLWLLRDASAVVALAGVGLLSCLVSPIAWSHHVVWVLPALAGLAVARWPAYVRVVAIAAVTLAFARWSSDQHLLALVECAVACALVPVLGSQRRVHEISASEAGSLLPR